MNILQMLAHTSDSNNSEAVKSIFSNRLDNLLEIFNLQKKELAKILGVSPVSITKYTKGDILPSFEVLITISKLFNVSTDYLLGIVNTPIQEKDFVYFSPIGKIDYSFKISEDEVIEGKLDYIFGLTVWNMDLPKDENSLNQFLCFKFSDEISNQRLYDCLFLTDELNVGYFLYTMSRSLGLPFMNEYSGPNSQLSKYLANLLIWNEIGIKPPIGNLQHIEPQYLAGLTIPTANQKVRLDYTYTSAAMPHVQAWLGMSEKERIDILMRRLRWIKESFK